MRRAVFLETLLPGPSAAAPLDAGIPALAHVVRDLERRVRPAEALAGRRHFRVTECGAVAASVPCLFGAPQPMTVLQQISVGRRVSALAARIAASMATGSWPSTFGTTCQP